ncbi:hypothetical protein MJO28_011004 [Puccinia striiformis f. sp. tritici]|uniref:Uncharacterized protein n=1 Tax=Puccinia striiformis f. sp. tritici TaxID=168172 RepID=A0ACC0E298_9BASI|nr:hypothetical protein MJO28_011004 [Puccinia striiformis f. sp. tritici]
MKLQKSNLKIRIQSWAVFINLTPPPTGPSTTQDLCCSRAPSTLNGDPSQQEYDSCSSQLHPRHLKSLAISLSPLEHSLHVTSLG